MSRRLVVIGVVVVALAVASSALAQTTPTAQTVTSTGNGQARVTPANRHNNASIAAAYDTAKKAAIATALSQAHEYASEYAAGVGLTLGSAISVSDAQNGFYGGPGPGFFGPFGPGQFCGTIRPFHRVVVNGRTRFIRGKKVHRCIVPPFAYTTLTVTYSAS